MRCYVSESTFYELWLISLPNTRNVIISVSQTTEKSNLTHSAPLLIVPHYNQITMNEKKVKKLDFQLARERTHWKGY